MSSAGVHTAVSLAAAGGLAYLGHLDLTVVGMTAVTVAGGAMPDIDRGTSLAGGLVPQWLAPDLKVKEGHARRIGPFLLRHHGPTHSMVVGTVIAGLLVFFSLLLSWPDHGRFGVCWLLGWDLHLALDPGAKQLLWPISLAWFGRKRAT